MNDTAIHVENLSKLYLIGSAKDRNKTFREAFYDFVLSPIHRLTKNTDLKPETTIWALNNVSFEVKRGEIVGIIGRNGAGKSTLLKILSRITEPTEGRAELRGRVGSLLEVGTGFHSELTGEENIYLSGAILGMSSNEISRKFNEIVSFAEVEKFIHTPVKHYSSGMYMRLAFAVAAHLEPEILLVDEVLAVGDAAFQKKCVGKMGDVAEQGRTVLFVSHNMGAITRICKRSIWLDEGKIVMDNSSNIVVNNYQSQYLTGQSIWKRMDAKTDETDFAFQTIVVTNNEGFPTAQFAGDEPISVDIAYVVHRPISGCQLHIRLYNSDGLVVFTTTDIDSSGYSALPRDPGHYHSLFRIPGRFLPPGTYYLFAAAQLPYITTYDKQEQTVVFDVSPSGSLTSLDRRLGIVTPLLHWETIKESLP